MALTALDLAIYGLMSLHNAPGASAGLDYLAMSTGLALVVTVWLSAVAWRGFSSARAGAPG